MASTVSLLSCCLAALVGIVSIVSCQLDPPSDMSAADMPTCRHDGNVPWDMSAAWAMSWLAQDGIQWHLSWHASFALALQMLCRLTPSHGVGNMLAVIQNKMTGSDGKKFPTKLAALLLCLMPNYHLAAFLHSCQLAELDALLPSCCDLLFLWKKKNRSDGTHGYVRAEYQGMSNIPSHTTRLATYWHRPQVTKNYLLPLPTYLLVFSFDNLLYGFMFIILLYLKTRNMQKITYHSASLCLPCTIIYMLAPVLAPSQFWHWAFFSPSAGTGWIHPRFGTVPKWAPIKNWVPKHDIKP